MPRPIQLAFAVRRRLLGLFRVRTRGVKVMVFNPAGELLLVRNSYGAPGLFLLPGGGIGRSEQPGAAASREVLEEAALELRDLKPLGTYVSGAEGKRDTIHLFRAVADGTPRPDAREVVEATFFPLDALPPNVSPATLRRIAELEGKQPSDGRW